MNFFMELFVLEMMWIFVLQIIEFVLLNSFLKDFYCYLLKV